VFEEHESGPEILALVIVGLSLAKEVIGLITAVIKARSEGIKKGDYPTDPLRLIVRRVHEKDGFREEQVLTIGHRDPIDKTQLQEQLTTALRKLLKEEKPPLDGKTRDANPASQRVQKKRAQRKKKS
jgi:hypothetical protein